MTMMKTRESGNGGAVLAELLSADVPDAGGAVQSVQRPPVLPLTVGSPDAPDLKAGDAGNEQHGGCADLDQVGVHGGPSHFRLSGILPRNVDLPASGATHYPLVKDTAAVARTLHARRALEQALDHGTALLAALGLPRLVDDGFVAIDREAAGAALAKAVALLDAIDPDPDLEPSLGAPERHPGGWGRLDTVDTSDQQSQAFWSDGGDPEGDREDDGTAEPGGDDEETLGWAANVSQLGLGPNTADGDVTAPERAGRGFMRCGADDLEPSLGSIDQQEAFLDWIGGRPVLRRADQRFWADGCLDDREEGDDNGIGDMGGVDQFLAEGAAHV